MHAVVADFQVRQPGALLLALLECEQIVAGAGRELAQLVEFRVITGGDHPAVANHHRRILDQRTLQECDELGKFAGTRPEFRQQGGFEAGTGIAQRGQAGERAAQPAEIARTRGTQRDPRQDAFHVADRGEQFARSAKTRIVMQFRDRRLARVQHVEPAQRTPQPAPQPATAHRGTRGIEHRGQRVLVTAAEIGIDLEVAQRRRIERDRILARIGNQRIDMGQGAALGFLRIAQQAAGRGNRQREVGAAKALEIAGAELLVQQLRRALQIELPRRAGTQAVAAAQRRTARGVLARQQLGRLQAAQFARQRVLAVDLEHQEAATREIERGDTESPGGFRHRHQQRVTVGVEQRFVGQRARRDDARDLAVHRALAGRRVTHLLADRHRHPGTHQAREITIDRVVRNTGHRDRHAIRGAAAGQRDVEQLRGTPGVVMEQLVEIAHAVEQQLVRVLCLDAQELLHHGGMSGLFGWRLAHVLRYPEWLVKGRHCNGPRSVPAIRAMRLKTDCRSASGAGLKSAPRPTVCAAHL